MSLRNGMISVQVDTYVDLYANEMLEEIGEDYVREWLRDGVRPDYDLSDPVVLLGVIAELRRLGFLVEPNQEVPC